MTEPVKARLCFFDIASKGLSVKEIEISTAADPDNLEARYQDSVLKVIAEEYTNALDGFIAILERNRKFRDGAARRGVLKVFEILGAEDPRVNEYRAKLARALL